MQDANWNTTAILAASGVPGATAGAVINRFVYTPYGDSQTLTASWATPAAGSTPAPPWAHLFQGLEFTAVTGLAYVRHRDYSATLGRFIELDPIGFTAGDSNWYRFVTNGPAGKTDPSGLWSWWWPFQPKEAPLPENSGGTIRIRCGPNGKASKIWLDIQKTVVKPELRCRLLAAEIKRLEQGGNPKVTEALRAIYILECFKPGMP